MALAEELHFGRAAERCHISQPAMSQQIRRLEHELDVRLAHRNKRTVSLTRAGLVFVAEARKMLHHMDDAAALALRTDRGEVGQLRLGVTAPALFVVYPEIAALFRARLPNVGLVVREMTTAEQEHALDGAIWTSGWCIRRWTTPAWPPRRSAAHRFTSRCR